MAHASLHEGVAAGRGNSFVFPHNDVKSLDTMIQKIGLFIEDHIFFNQPTKHELCDRICFFLNFCT